MGLNVCPRCGAELVTEEMIAERIAVAAQFLFPDVVRIRYHLGQDWAGTTALFIRVVIADEAYNDGRLPQIFRKARLELVEQVKPNDLGRILYVNFRTVSEQAKLKEPEWE